jgi:pimeloyl-ACP methyl ester carboxylesterase
MEENLPIGREYFTAKRALSMPNSPVRKAFFAYDNSSESYRIPAEICFPRSPPTKVPVLLIHGTWGNAQTWDFPRRSVMDYLASGG